jgi:hypothetical protein
MNEIDKNNPERITIDEMSYVHASAYDSLWVAFTALLKEMRQDKSWSDAQLSQVSKDRLQAMKYLRREHGSLKITPHTLYTLSEALKCECRDFLYELWGDKPKTMHRIEEVFKKPRRSRVKKEPTQRNPFDDSNEYPSVI